MINVETAKPGDTLYIQLSDLIDSNTGDVYLEAQVVVVKINYVIIKPPTNIRVVEWVLDEVRLEHPRGITSIGKITFYNTPQGIEIKANTKYKHNNPYIKVDLSMVKFTVNLHERK